MYKFRYFYLLSVLAALPVQAQEIDMRQKLQEVFNTPQIQEMLNSGFQVSDVNSDGFISKNEFSYIVNSVDTDISLTDEQKTAKKQRLQQYFKQVDVNKDNKLDKDEYVVFLQKESEFEAKERVEKINEMAKKSPDEIIKDFNTQMDKAKVALNNFQKMSPDEIADKFLSGVSNNIAEENYFQMDKDKDGCVTEDEYAEYMVVFAKNTDTFAEDNLSKDDWRDIYREDEKKAKENCLTKEEYLSNFNEMTDLSGMYDSLEEKEIDSQKITEEE